ncbi:hypothetical protein JCM8202_005118 [Rhodotorula sphaerocarpa]
MAAAADKMEQMFLDGTHPALHRDATAAATLRAGSPERERSPEREDRRNDDEGEDDEQPRFSAVDPDPPRGGAPAPLREATNAGGGGGRRRGEESRNTGVKGVRADYAQAMLAQQEQPSATAGGGLARKMEQSLSLSRRRRQQEEEDELALLRQKRLAQLQGSGERHRDRVTRAGRLFGHLSEVGMEGFVAAVEEEDPETAVVVHLYEPDIPACATLNTHLATLARQHPGTKFLRAQASEVDFMQSSSEADADVTLPTVLVYRAGDLETTWVRFDFELEGQRVASGEAGRGAVEEVLVQAGVLARRAIVAGSRTRAPVSDPDDSE